MNGQQTAVETGGAERLTVTEHTGKETLQECVSQALKNYFAQLGDHSPCKIYQMVLTEVERPLFREVMQQAGGNQTRAASMLGISRSTLRKKLAQHGLD